MDVKGAGHCAGTCPVLLSTRVWVSRSSGRYRRGKRKCKACVRAAPCPVVCRAAKAEASVLAGERAQENGAGAQEASTSGSNAQLYPAQRKAQVRSMTVEEDTQGRAGYHRELLAAAKEGRVQDAETVVQSMVNRGVQPGPLAYHGLICAYCKAQDSKGALAVARRAAQEGLQLIAESYLAIMHALMVDRDRPTAFGVWQSMLAAGIDPQKGWLMLCKDCFSYGFPVDGYGMVQSGRLEGWRPDADLYEQLIAWMCTQEDLVDVAEQIVRQELPEAGIQPEARHANPLVFAEAVNVSVHTAISGPMKEMQEGRLGIGCRPNADTYNAITQGCIIAMQREDGSGGSAVYEKLQEIKGDMIKAGLKFNKRTHALFVEAHILDCNTEFAMLAFEDMAKLARPGTVTGCLPDEALSRLLVTLARENRPGDILRVLTAMQGDWRPLPAAALMPLGLAGSSFLTSWVPAALDSARSMRNVKGLTSQTSEDEEDEDFQEIDGVLIGPGGFAVTDEGAVISVSKLAVPQLRAELVARGLSAEGKRHDLYRRVQAARASAPREVADEVRSLEKRKRDKAVREEQNLKTKAAKAREKQAALWQIECWKDGKMVSSEQVMEMEEPEDEEGDWDEDELARKLRAAKDKTAAPEGAEEDDLEELRERYGDADVEAKRPWWPQDTSAGELALQMAGIAESLGSMGTLGDWAMLAKAAAQERNPAVTAAVLERLPYLAEVAAEEGDERLKDLFAEGNTKGVDLEQAARALMW